METQLPPVKVAQPQFSGYVYCGQMAGWTKKPPILSHCPLWPNGWMDQDATWYGCKRRPRRRCVRWGFSAPLKGAQPPSFRFMVHVYCSQTAGWQKTPLGTEVYLGPDHIVLEGVPALLERGTAAEQPPLSAHVYYGHGRPSQLYS